MPFIGDQIVLTEPEQRLAKFLAAARYEAARKAGIKDQKIGPQSCEDTDLEGIAAEIAFCRLFNVYPDLQLDKRPPYDAVVNGLRIDVKATKYKTGRLLVAPWKKDKELPIDIFALVTGEFPGPYRYCGCMEASELMIPERIKNLGHGNGYAADQEELKHVVFFGE